MTEAVKIRNTALGEGIPKICVPLTGGCGMELKTQAEAAVLAGADLAEWRADYMDREMLRERLGEVGKALREVLGETPLIFTLRTDREGGRWSGNAREYAGLCLSAAETGCADLIDLEVETLREGGIEASELIRELKRRGCRVLASNHHFEGTPSAEEIVAQLLSMDRDGADILKEAVMPGSSADVLALLRATELMKGLTDKPVVTMAMGRLGIVSRLAGEVFGSAITFGTVGSSSAPGQVPLEELRRVLSLLHGRSL